MNQEIVISLVLLDNRTTETLNEFYEIPTIENEEIKRKVEYAMNGNYPELIKLYDNIAMAEITSSLSASGSRNLPKSLT